MNREEIIQVAMWAALSAGAIALLGEWLHARRARRLSALAVGPATRARWWTVAVSPLRIVALAGVMWALTVLIAFEGSSRLHERNAAATRHLMVLLDVSPSMETKDAGEGGNQT